MLNEREIRELLKSFRKRVEGAWTDETASPRVKPLAGKPDSAGQCAPTSILLFRELKQKFGNDLALKIALGQVLHAESQKVAIELHVWLQLYEHVYQPPLVLDTTPDQGDGIDDKVICSQNTELVLSNKLVYLPYNLFTDPTELSSGAQERAELLLQNIGLFTSM